MTEKQHKIIDKVKKLLRLAASSSFESEAKAAAVRAQELLREYRLEISDVDDLREDDNCDESETFCPFAQSISPTHIKLLVQSYRMWILCKSHLCMASRQQKGLVTLSSFCSFCGRCAGLSYCPTAL